MARSRTAADTLVERLIEWGIDVVFGLPGDGINGVFESLRTHQDEIRFVHVRHEETAALAACSYGKFTGRPAACLATAAPGAVHLMNGLYDALIDQSPVFAITGYAQLRALRDRYGSLIRERYPDVPRRISGYNLDSLLPETGSTSRLRSSAASRRSGSCSKRRAGSFPAPSTCSGPGQRVDPPAAVCGDWQARGGYPPERTRPALPHHLHALVRRSGRSSRRRGFRAVV